MLRGQIRPSSKAVTMSALAAVTQPRRLLDLAEQIAVLALYSWLVVRLWPGEFSASNWYPLLILLSEGLVVLLLLIRRPTDRISTKGRDWALAAGGTFIVLFVDQGGPALMGPLGAVLMLVGLAIHVGAKLSLRRSFGLVAANRGVKVGGFYRLVRHPMYAGYMLSHAGFLLVAPSLWNLALYVLAWALLIARIYAEEQVLSEDPAYQAFRTRVRYRLLPGIF
jgi:protein-S-isoprenylcysteine O-methyltransferase Ste14